MHRTALIPVALLAALAVAAPAFPSAEEADSRGRSREDLAMEDFLRTAEVTKIEDIGEGVTKPVRLSLEKDGRTERAIFKTVDVQVSGPTRTNSEIAPVETNFTDRWAYEVAAYRLDRLIGLDLVPPTVVREIEGRKGSAQLWIDGVRTLEKALADNEPVQDFDLMRDRMMWMWIFDALIYNVDRRDKNILVHGPTDRFVLIDHSRAFRRQRRLPPFDEKGGRTVPAELIAGMEALDRETLDEELGELLESAQIKSILKRRDLVLEMLEDEGLTP